MITDQQSIEIFHLIFLRLLKNQMDSSLYAIKGGCNLRFFFESIRYSEDIDFDIAVISTQTLKKKIDGILNSTSLQHGLATYGLEVSDTSAPKQTSTVQRWKVGIKAKNRVRVIPTKIEFSRRKLDSARKAEPVSSFILQDYKFSPMILSHYLYPSAVEQKINALIFRTETQARDIFDLNLLFLRRKEIPFKLNFDLQRAVDCTLEISFDNYSSQVVSYLLPEYVEHYGQANIWAQIQLFVIEKLKEFHLNEIS